MMKVARVRGGRGIDAMAVTQEAIPEASVGEALVRLTAATLNYRDLIMVKGLIPGIWKEPELIPLSCAAGEVVAVGSGVSRVKAGDRVMPIFAPGWMSGAVPPPTMLGGSVDGVARQYGVFAAASLCHLPDEMGDFDGATLACAGLTAWSALTRFRAIQPGEWVLAHGTGGVAIAALQLAKAMGAQVALTSSADAKLHRARALGADVTINYRRHPDWVAALRDALGNARIANVIDTVGGVQFDDNASLLQPDGQISAIGMLGSDFSWSRDNPGVSIAPISTGNRDQHEALTAFMVRHHIRPVVDVVYDLTRIQDAYRHLESGKFFGKVGISLL